MAYGNQSKRLLVLLGDGGGSEVFAAPCGAKAYSVQLINNISEDMVLDCSDPLDEPAVTLRWVDSQDMKISLSGTVDRTAFETWRVWADDATEKNIRVQFDESAANNGGYWSAAALLSEFSMNKEMKGLITFEATIVTSGGRTWTDAV